MSDYLDLLKYGQDSVDDFNVIIEKQLAKAWLEAYKQVDTELAAFMGRFGDLEDAQKYNRLAALKDSIASEFKTLTGQAIKDTTATSTNAVTTSFESTWFGMEKSIGAELNFGVLPVDAIRASVFSELSGADFATRFGKLYSGTVDKIAETITRAMATGQGYAKTAAQIKELWQNSFYQALRVIRTESARNYSEGALMAYQKAEEQGIEGAKTWLATRDGRTRDAHARLNGKAADKKGYFYIGSDKAKAPAMFSQPENSIACRCTTYYKLKGYEQDYAPDWTYKQWKAEFGDWKKLPNKRVKQYGNAKTVSDAQKQLSEIIGTDNISFEGIDIEMSNSHVKGADKFIKEFPFMKGEFEMVKTASLKQDVLGEYFYGVKSVRLSKKISNLDEYAKYAIKSASSGFHYKSWVNPESLIQHEFSHGLENYLIKLTSNGDIQKHNLSMKNMLVPRTIYRELKKQGYDFGYLGRYATVNHSEWFAEAVSEYISSGGENAQSKAVVDMVKDIIKRGEL